MGVIYFAKQLKVEDIKKSKNTFLCKKFSTDMKAEDCISYNILNISKKANGYLVILMESDFFLLSL